MFNGIVKGTESVMEQSIEEQEKWIAELSEEFKKIADENFIPMTNRTARMFAMIANTKRLK